MCLFQFCFAQGICLGVGLLGHTVVLFLVLYGISLPSSIVAVSIYIPTTVQEHSLFSTPSPAFIIHRHFDDGHSDWYRLPCSSNGKESACNAGDQGSIPGLGSSSGEGNGNPLQYSCLENSMDREVGWATVCGVTKSRTRLSN